MNIERRTVQNEALEPMTRGFTHLNRGLEHLELLRYHIDAYSEQSGYVLSQYLLTSIGIVDVICRELTTALRYDNTQALPVIQIDPLLSQLVAQVTRLNHIIQASNSGSVMVGIALTDRVFQFSLIESAPTRPVMTPVVLRGSAYLKQVALVQDLTVSKEAPSCECPLCLEETKAVDTILTNCKHGFCGTCIKSLATSIKDSTKKPCCPMCRQEITELTARTFEAYNEMEQHISSL
jgi:hypothetical protein